MEIPVHNGNLCARCGDSLNEPGDDSTSNVCRTCRLATPPFVRAVSYGPYSGRMREIIHALKYDRLRPAARRLGRMLAQAFAQVANEAPAEMLVVPVPLHKSKHFERGFNQAWLLASEAIVILRKTHPEWRLSLAPRTLIRLRATNSQAGLTSRQRRLNVRGAFRVPDPSAVSGKHVLIVDDILTTGATARAAARALITAGAETVWVATLARARRITPIRLGSVESTSASFEVADDSHNPPGGTPGFNLQPASMYSEDQRSF